MQTGIARLPVLLILAMAGLGLLRYSDETPDADPGLSQGSIQTPVPSGQRPDAILVGPGQAEGVDLRADFERILRETRNQEGIWAVLAVSLDLGDTLLAENPRLPVVPASNQKLLTTGAAFHILGPDFRYQTFLLSDGTLADGRLDGNLILYGTGDPTLSDRFFPSETAPLDSLVRRVTEAGIQEVRGDLVIDGSYFSGPELHPDWKASDLNDEPDHSAGRGGERTADPAHDPYAAPRIGNPGSEHRDYRPSGDPAPGLVESRNAPGSHWDRRGDPGRRAGRLERASGSGPSAVRG
jgi:hypothetical protein